MSKKKNTSLTSVDEAALDSPTNTKEAAKKKIRKNPETCTSWLGVQTTAWDSPAGRIVGSQIQDWWDGENAWFSGRILRFNSSTGEHLVKYDEDNDEMWLNVSTQPVLICSRVRIIYRFFQFISLIVIELRWCGLM